MDDKLTNVTADAERHRELVRRWGDALGMTVTADHDEYLLLEGDAGTGMAFKDFPGTAPGRVHVDLTTADPAATITRLLERGAAHVADHEAPGGAFSWTVLADPDGDEFCVTAGH